MKFLSTLLVMVSILSSAWGSVLVSTFQCERTPVTSDNSELVSTILYSDILGKIASLEMVFQGPIAMLVGNRMLATGHVTKLDESGKSLKFFEGEKEKESKINFVIDSKTKSAKLTYQDETFLLSNCRLPGHE